jgi:osmotically-inducible protein OsmY
LSRWQAPSSEEMIAKAMNVALSVEGVREVISTLQVQK